MMSSSPLPVLTRPLPRVCRLPHVRPRSCSSPPMPTPWSGSFGAAGRGVDGGRELRTDRRMDGVDELDWSRDKGLLIRGLHPGKATLTCSLRGTFEFVGLERGLGDRGETRVDLEKMATQLEREGEREERPRRREEKSKKGRRAGKGWLMSAGQKREEQHSTGFAFARCSTEKRSNRGSSLVPRGLIE